ncbi:Crp/Fnr family transcriptional regulator [Roseomonas sp. BN140053]|uniref:Crp/Fnr family transcriptional regulator n=1 Tax=Roseomonas sp. BN140053 TaxID=3391898 RepID=UPI0039ECB2A0
MLDAALQPSQPRNRLLRALPESSLARLRPFLNPVELSLRQVLHDPERPIETVYFPETGWISMIAPLEDGEGAEVGMIGPDGVVGIPVVLGGDCDDLEALVQNAGTALSIGTGALREAMAADPVLQGLLLRYALVHLGQVSRTAACNGRHSTEQRLARWLLMAHDRTVGDEFTMTHEFLAIMLGLRRAGVTVAAGALQRAGLIRYQRGCITVTDRPGLESASCECYSIVRRDMERLLGRADGERAAPRR